MVITSDKGSIFDLSVYFITLLSPTFNSAHWRKSVLVFRQVIIVCFSCFVLVLRVWDGGNGGEAVELMVDVITGLFSTVISAH